MIAKILRFLSYGFNLVIAIAMLALGLVSKFSALDLRLEMLPWTGHELTNWLIGLGILGIGIVGLSMFGILRWLLLVWSVIIIYLWGRAIYVPGWTFDGREPFNQTVQAFVSYVVTSLGAVSAARQGSAKS
jgi:hypothetical protein